MWRSRRRVACLNRGSEGPRRRICFRSLVCVADRGGFLTASTGAKAPTSLGSATRGSSPALSRSSRRSWRREEEADPSPKIGARDDKAVGVAPSPKTGARDDKAVGVAPSSKRGTRDDKGVG